MLPARDQYDFHSLFHVSTTVNNRAGDALGGVGWGAVGVRVVGWGPGAVCRHVAALLASAVCAVVACSAVRYKS